MGEVEEMLCDVCVGVTEGHSSDLGSTLCKYDLRKGELFVLSWAGVRLIRCGGGAHSIWLFHLVAGCLEKIYVCIWHMFVFMSVVVTFCGFVGMFVVHRGLLKIVF